MINSINGTKMAGMNGKLVSFVTRYPTGTTQPAASSNKNIAVIRKPPRNNPNPKSFHQAGVNLTPKSENGRRSMSLPASQILRDMKVPLAKKANINVKEGVAANSERGLKRPGLLKKTEPIKDRNNSLIAIRSTIRMVWKANRQTIRKRLSRLFQKMFFMNSNSYPVNIGLVEGSVGGKTILMQDYSNSNMR